MRLITFGRASVALSALAVLLFAAVGCVSSHSQTASAWPGVPAEAAELSGGTHNLTTLAADSGTLYVYDLEDARVIWTGPIDAGQRLVVDIVDGRVMINAMTVYHDSLDRSHQLAVYLEKSQVRS